LDLKIKNGAGSITFLQGQIQLFREEDLIARLHLLHLHACGEPPSNDDETKISPADAKLLFRRGMSTLLVQIATLPPEDARNWLSLLTSAASRIGNTGGLEAAFAASLFALPPNDGDLATAALVDWSKLELDERPGGNHQYSIVLRPDTSEFVKLVPKDLMGAAKLANGSRSDARSQVAMQFGTAGMTHQQCISAVSLTAAAGGAIIIGGIGAVGGYFGGKASGAGRVGGAIAGAIGGAKVGWEIGDTGGTKFGDIHCPAPSSPAPAPSPGGGGGGGGGGGAAPIGGEDDDDGTDTPPPVIPDPDGCWSPWWDLIYVGHDPYAAYGLGTTDTYVAKGAGLLAYSSSRASGIMRLDSTDTLELTVKSLLRPTNAAVIGRRNDWDADQKNDWKGGQQLGNARGYARSTIYGDFALAQRIFPPSATSTQSIGYKVVTSVITKVVKDSDGNETEIHEAGPSVVLFDEGSAANAMFPRGMSVPAGANIPALIVRLTKNYQVIDPPQSNMLVSGGLT
jgi:hypothetical protein